MSNLPPPPPESTPESTPPQLQSPQSQSPHLPPPPTFDPGSAQFTGAPLVTPATKGRRVFAGLLDGLIFGAVNAVTSVVWFAFNSDGGAAGTVFGPSRIAVSIPSILVLTYFFRWSSSPAKRSLGLVVVDSRTGEPAGFKQMAQREWGAKYLLATLTGGLTYLISAFMLLATGRALWDVIARTKVLNQR